MGRPAESYPSCPFRAGNCFAYVKHSMGCKALEDTNFDLWRGCPFYKSKEQRMAELEAKKRTDDLYPDIENMSIEDFKKLMEE